MSDVFVWRQPIYDRKTGVVGYELHFRNADADGAEILDDDSATCQMLANTLVDIGLENLCGTRPVFVNFTREFVDGRFPIPFERERIVVQVLEDIHFHEALLDDLRQLRTLGFQIALDHFALTPAASPFLQLASIVKLNPQGLSERKVAEHLAELRRLPVKALATQIGTHDEFDRYLTAGFDLFQGGFLSHPRMIKGRQLPKNRRAIELLLAKVQDPDVKFHELESLVGQDVALTVRLLQLVNSSSMGLQKKVDSIERALVLVGLARVRNLVTLLTLAGMGDSSSALLETALVRAKMCERLGASLNGNCDAYFMVGLLSILDLFLQRPLEEILKALPLSKDVADALRNFTGGMGNALKCVLAYEQGHAASAKCLHLKKTAIQEAYLAAIAWAAHSVGDLRS